LSWVDARRGRLARQAPVQVTPLTPDRPCPRYVLDTTWTSHAAPGNPGKEANAMMRMLSLLVAPLAMSTAACDDDTVTPPAAPTVVEVALAVNAETGEFSTLIAALQAAGLVETLQGAGPFTVFAPTDAAFAAIDLNADNIGSLPVDALRNILLYHVAPGRLDA